MNFNKEITDIELYTAVIKYLELVAQCCGENDKKLFKDIQVSLPLREMNQYFSLLKQYEIATKDCILTALVYMGRMTGSGDLICSSDNVEAVFTAALLIANKFHEDIPFDNKTFSRLADMYLNELNAIELQIVLALKFNCTVTKDELDHTEATLKMILHQFCNTNNNNNINQHNPAPVSSNISS